MTPTQPTHTTTEVSEAKIRNLIQRAKDYYTPTKLLSDIITALESLADLSAPHNFQTNGPGIIGSDLCTICGKEREDHDQ